MITANGKEVIKRFHARRIGQIAGALSFGVGSAAPNVNDVRLQYEVARVPIVSVSVDPSADSIVFRGILPVGMIKTVHEVGLWSSSFNDVEASSLGILSGSPNPWTNGTLTNLNSRANANAVQINYVANGTTNAELNGFATDLSRFTDADSVVVGYYATTNLSSLRIRLGADAANYWEFLLPAPTTNGYNIARVSRSVAVKTGNPDWSNIGYIAIRPSATSAGAGSVYFDGIRFEPNSLVSSNLLVARSVLATPSTPDTDIDNDVEYALRINIS